MIDSIGLLLTGFLKVNNPICELNTPNFLEKKVSSYTIEDIKTPYHKVIKIDKGHSITLEQSQIDNLKLAYNYGKHLYLDEQNLGVILRSIMLGESSAGKKIVGDNISNGKVKAIKDASIGKFQIRLSTVDFIVNSDPELKQKYGDIVNDKRKIISKLFDDDKFSMDITYVYLLRNYITSKKFFKNKKEYIDYAISRHNGGWENKEYLKHIEKQIKIVNALVKQQIIS